MMFEKNIEYITNETLKTKLKSMRIEESRIGLSFCMTPSNDYLLMKNDVPIDDLNDPRKAVQEMFKKNIKSEMGPNDIIITFGIGLCYLLDEVFNTYPSRIFVYEPDINILHFVLNNVDISEHLSSGRVYITDNLDDLIKELSSKYMTKDKVEVIYLQNYAVVKSQELLELTQKVYETCKSKTVDINTITRYSKKWLYNSINNIKEINTKDVYKLSDLEEKFINQTAIILAAGPSLNENIEKIKANREKFVVFAVNKVLRKVISEGIIPDFAVCVDAEYIDNTLNGLEEYLDKISCITDLKSDNFIFSKNFRKIFVSFTETDQLVKKLLGYNNFIKTYESGGSATTMAFVAAVKMGFSKIIFCGLDLAFKDSVVYSTGETVDRISENKIQVGNIVKDVTKIPSVKGDYVLTTDDYAAFVQHFEFLIKELEYSEVYNTTSFGAKIAGMKNSSFDDIILLGLSNTTALIVGDCNPFKLEIKEFAQEELVLINNIIMLISKNVFSPALVSSIVKSTLMYQYMQSDILKVLQSKMDEGYADEFISKAKLAIKDVIDLLQQNSMI